MMDYMQPLEELTQNLNRVRENAESLGRTKIVHSIDGFRIGLGQAISLSRIPDRITNAEEYGPYADLVKAAVKLLGGICRGSDSIGTRRQLFRGYQKISGYAPNAEFENYRERVEPAILRDASG